MNKIDIEHAVSFTRHRPERLVMPEDIPLYILILRIKNRRVMI